MEEKRTGTRRIRDPNAVRMVPMRIGVRTEEGEALRVWDMRGRYEERRDPGRYKIW